MVSVEQIKKLREETGLGMLDCKNALEQAGGDHAKAVDILRTNGKQVNTRRAERTTECGLIDTYVHAGGQVGVMVQLGCESPAGAKSDELKSLAHNIAMQLAAFNVKYISRENISVDEIEHEQSIHMQVAKDMGKPEAAINNIVKGKMEKFYSENCLIDSVSIFDNKMKIKDMINSLSNKMNEKITVVRFERWNI